LKVYENRVLRNISEPEGQEVVEDWGRIHSKELYDIYFSPHSIRVVISRRIRCAGYVARMRGEIQGVSKRALQL
jgi:hypothetical protein